MGRGGPDPLPPGGDDPTIDPETGKKIDYYKLLGLDGWPGDAAAKKAYYRAAMRMHPDRNRDNQEQAEALFKYLQEAWTTLSDPTERAWYDRHKAEVLSPADLVDEFFGVDTHVNLRAYRSPSCYSGVDDTPRGFYGVYSALFATLTAEEIRAARSRIERGSYLNSDLERLRLKAGLSLAGMPGVTLDPGSRGAESGPSPYTVFPGFGGSAASRAEVNRFYAYWSAFTSVKEFSHLDLYSTKGEPSRVRRAAQMENERMRQDGREKFSERVRELVAYIKRRDPRIPAFEEEQRRREQEERERQEQEQERKKQAKREERDRLREEVRARAAELKAKLEDGSITAYEMQELESLVVTGPAASDRVAVELEAGYKARQRRGAEEPGRPAQPKPKAEKAEALAGISKESRSQGLDYDPASGKMFCSVCNQRVQTEGEFRNHLASKRHKRALAEGKEQKSVEKEGGKEGRKGRGPDPESSDEPRRGGQSVQSSQSLASLTSLEDQLSAIGRKRRRRRGESEGDSDAADNAVGAAAARSPVPEPEAAAGGAGGEKGSKGRRRGAREVGRGEKGEGTEGGEGGEGAETLRGSGDAGNAGNAAESANPPTRPRGKAGNEGQGGQGGQQGTFKCMVCGAAFDSRTKMFKHVREKGHAALKR